MVSGVKWSFFDRVWGAAWCFGSSESQLILTIQDIAKSLNDGEQIDG